MANLNQVHLIGRLTNDPELRKTQSDLSVTSFTVAINRRGKDAGADFIDCVAWRGSAEFVAKYFKKGDPIFVGGSVSTRNFEDKNGNKRKAVEVLANDIQFVADKGDKKAEPSRADMEEFEAEEQEWPF